MRVSALGMRSQRGDVYVDDVDVGVGEKGRVGVGGQFGSPFCMSPIWQARSLNGEMALVISRHSKCARAPPPFSTTGSARARISKKFAMPSYHE
jgi:hypothetical protein